jgi:hypothetical protein
MIINLPYSPHHSLEWLENFFKKDYYKKPYDRFMWWRSFTPKRRPLHARQPFIDRLINGDFDVAPYRYEAEIVEHRLNEKWVELRDDPGRYLQEESVNIARRKRLLLDYEKEEAKRLEELRNLFVREFKMSKQEYDLEAEQSNSESLIDFYYDIKNKYGTYNLVSRKIKVKKLVS